MIYKNIYRMAKTMDLITSGTLIDTPKITVSLYITVHWFIKYAKSIPSKTMISYLFNKPTFLKSER